MQQLPNMPAHSSQRAIRSYLSGSHCCYSTDTYLQAHGRQSEQDLPILVGIYTP